MECKRMPKLQMDEVMLLVDTYFKIDEANDDKQIINELIKQLSKNMRSLPFYPEFIKNREFRSIDGMKMCLSNVKYVDPKKESSFCHGSKLQRLVFNYYSEKRELLDSYVKCMLKVVSERFIVNNNYSNFIGGALIPSFHEFYEKNNRTVQSVKKEMIISGKTKCSMCNEDLANRYKDFEDLLEMHLNIPFENNCFAQNISLGDLIMVCPCCHKRLHATPENFLLENAKKTMIG